MRSGRRQRAGATVWSRSSCSRGPQDADHALFDAACRLVPLTCRPALPRTFSSMKAAISRTRRSRWCIERELGSPPSSSECEHGSGRAQVADMVIDGRHTKDRAWIADTECALRAYAPAIDCVVRGVAHAGVVRACAHVGEEILGESG